VHGQEPSGAVRLFDEVGVELRTLAIGGGEETVIVVSGGEVWDVLN
jgi:hypothetical protein